MFRKFIQNLPKLDWWLCTAVFLLALLSLVIIGSIILNADQANSTRLMKQVIFVALGVGLMFIVSQIDYRLLRNYAFIFYVGAALLLLAVLLFGTTIRGTTGWFNFGFFSFQPVEIVKICLIMFLAYYFSEKTQEFFDFKNILTSGLFVALLLGLVVLQPDLGSALIFLVIWLGLLFLIKTKKKYLLIIIASLLLIIVVSWFAVLKDYQKERILNFVDPSRDPLGTGYNLSQSLVAIGSGNIWGRGLGLGPQSQLNFLPEQEDDFIFAVIAEELGFVGACLIIILFTVIFYRILRIMRNANNDFAFFLSAGILISFFGQFCINIGMNIGLMPITGLPLPFVSAGGSSLISSFIALGILQNIYLQQKK